MEYTESQLAVAIIIGCLVLIILAVFLLLFLLFFMNKKRKLFREQLLLQQQFQTELVQTRIEVQEQTSRNLASELHDNIGQLLSLTNVTLASINPDDIEKTRQKVNDTKELVSRSIKELRQLSKLVHGEQLIKSGLAEAIKQELAWVERSGVYSVNFVQKRDNGEQSQPDKDLFLYRLLQESLNNIIKHANATRIDLSLSEIQGVLQLVIADNGSGFDVETKMNSSEGLGLQNMQKRISLLGGEMQVESTAAKGTTITFTIPYP
jgi:two-component system NarL family sensor kinase